MKFKIIGTIIVLLILIVLYVMFNGETSQSEGDSQEQVITE